MMRHAGGSVFPPALRGEWRVVPKRVGMGGGPADSRAGGHGSFAGQYSDRRLTHGKKPARGVFSGLVWFWGVLPGDYGGCSTPDSGGFAEQFGGQEALLRR